RSMMSGRLTHGSTIVNLPLVMRNNNGYNTWFSVQNAGDSDTEVTVEFIAGPAGNNYTAPTVTIKPGGAVIFDQAAPDMSVLGTKFVGAVKITSDPEPVVATLVEAPPISWPMTALGWARNSSPRLVTPSSSGRFSTMITPCEMSIGAACRCKT
ncbi:MAG: hypothetical protein H5T71_00685, partial [Chloroflexi bacterium]|nr:hypothetical protein [Chloroflexota bacterium]